MNNPISSSIVTHLEFLGFNIEDGTNDGPSDILYCKHESRSNIIAFISKNDIIILQSTYSWIEWNSMKLLEKINEIHSRVSFTRWYIVDLSEKDKNIRIEMSLKWYNRQDFWEAVESFEKEISINLPELSNI